MKTFIITAVAVAGLYAAIGAVQAQEAQRLTLGAKAGLTPEAPAVRGAPSLTPPAPRVSGMPPSMSPARMQSLAPGLYKVEVEGIGVSQDLDGQTYGSGYVATIDILYE